MRRLIAVQRQRNLRTFADAGAESSTHDDPDCGDDHDFEHDGDGHDNSADDDIASDA